MDAIRSLAAGDGDPAAIALSFQQASRDLYIGDSIVGSPGAHIGPEGLDEEATTRLFEQLLSLRENAEYVRSSRDYLSALRQFGRPTYQTLALRFPESVVELEEVYVPLRATRADGTSESLFFSEAIRRVFRSEPRMLLVEGAPGSGKSTLIRQIARHAWHDPDRIGLDRRYIALPLRLRSLAQSSGAGLEDRIWKAIDYSHDLTMVGSRPPAGFYEKWPLQLQTPWLLLLDGFDEVREEHRADIIAFIRRLTDAGTPLLITSRPTGALPEDLRNTLRKFVIDPFSTEQQRQLAELWLGSDAADFEAAFKRVAAGDLGRTPLLLTIAAITYHKSHELPARRSELYRVFVDDTWQEAWRQGKTDELGAELSEVAPAIVPLCLRQIARAMTEGRGESSALDFGADPNAQAALIKNILVTEMNLSDSIASFRAKKILKFLGSASGIFKATEHQCEWLHPTFREFLTAEDLVASSDSDSVLEVLERFRDPSWRQVALFILSILSEHGSVSSLLQRLKMQDHPYGLAFVGTAIAEGANVDEDLKQETLRGLCDDIRANARKGLCDRLLTREPTGRQTRQALSLLMQDGLSDDVTAALAADLGGLACAYGRDVSSAMADLKQLHMFTEIDQLAADSKVPIRVRAEAACEQYISDNASRKERGFLNVLEVIRQAVAAQWPLIALIIAKTNDPSLLIHVARSELLSPEHWGLMLDEIRPEAAPKVLSELAESDDLPPDFRLAAKLRLINDGDQIISLLLSSSEKRELVRAGIASLVRNKDGSKVLEIANESKLSDGVRRIAIRALAQLGAKPELQTLVGDTNLAYRLRRRAAEALYGSVSMDFNTALLLYDKFFDHLGKLSETPRILQRRAFLHYFTGERQNALDLLDQLELKRTPTAWSLEVRGHCLQSLGRDDEAIAAYSAALKLDPNRSYPRCQRSIIYWSQDKRDLALADIRESKTYSAPSWYLKFAGDMLRKAGKVDLADEWLDRALEAEPDAADQINVTKGEAQFDRGYFGSAVRFFEAALKVNPSYAIAKDKMAMVLRVAGQFEQSAACYSDLLAVDPTNVTWLCGRSQDLMRLGKAELASEDLQAAIKAQNDPWHDYLEALYLAFSGNRTEFKTRIDRLISSNAFGHHRLLHNRSNTMLLNVATGNLHEARRMLDGLIEAKEFNYLCHNTVAALDDLATALSDVPEISKFHDLVKKALWPDGCGIDVEPDPRLTALKRIQRNACPLPMYCQKQAIGGLGQDKELANAILTRAGSEPKTIVIWSLDAPTKLYGQCNFKMDADAQYELKFCDTLQTVLENLSELVQEYGARRLLFLQQDLLERFRKQVTSKRLPAQCLLIDPAWIPKPKSLV